MFSQIFYQSDLKLNNTHKILSSNHVYLDFQQREVTLEVLHNLPFFGLAGSGQWGRRHDIRGRHRARVGDVPTLTQLGRGAGCPDFYTAGVIIVIQRTHSGAKIHKCIFDIWDIKIEYWATYTGSSRSTCTYFVTGVSTGSVFMPSLFHFDSTSVVSPLADSCSTVISNPPKPVRENRETCTYTKCIHIRTRKFEQYLLDKYFENNWD